MERFWNKVEKQENGCWLWTGAVNNSSGGYGRFNYEGKNRIAHRVAWALTHGEMPDGRHVCHKCDTPRCVNPDHLFLGSQADNMRDMKAKGRSPDNALEKNPRAKLTEENVRFIRQTSEPAKVLAAAFGVTPALIWQIRRGEIWKGVA